MRDLEEMLRYLLECSSEPYTTRIDVMIEVLIDLVRYLQMKEDHEREQRDRE